MLAISLGVKYRSPKGASSRILSSSVASQYFLNIELDYKLK